MNKLLIKTGNKLSRDEIDQINLAKKREFKAPPLQEKDLKDGLFFLLFDDKKILATGQLIPVGPIDYNGETFFILGMGGILASKKGKRYGKQIMTAIKDRLVAKNKTGVGFCRLGNKGFYEKCGFKVDTTSIKRFVFQKGDRKITNSGDDCVVYLDASDRFMEKVLFRLHGEVIVSRSPDW